MCPFKGQQFYKEQFDKTNLLETFFIFLLYRVPIFSNSFFFSIKFSFFAPQTKFTCVRKIGDIHIETKLCNMILVLSSFLHDLILFFPCFPQISHSFPTHTSIIGKNGDITFVKFLQKRKFDPHFEEVCPHPHFLQSSQSLFTHPSCKTFTNNAKNTKKNPLC